MQNPRTCTLIIQDRMNFLPLTQPIPNNNLGYVKVSQQTCRDVYVNNSSNKGRCVCQQQQQQRTNVKVQYKIYLTCKITLYVAQTVNT